MEPLASGRFLVQVDPAGQLKFAPLISPWMVVVYPCGSLAVRVMDAPLRHQPPLPPTAQFNTAVIVGGESLGVLQVESQVSGSYE